MLSDSTKALALASAAESDTPLARALVARSAAADPLGTAGWTGSLPSEGEGRILMLRVSFPKDGDVSRRGFRIGDTLDALQALVGPHLDGSMSETRGMRLGASGSFPYESASAYYGRSSYGRLSLAGEAYDYEAERPRDGYSGDWSEIFLEAVSSLDGDVDLSDFDGDGDGVIDCVVLHFAGGDEGWGSRWWSYEFPATSGETYDGVRLGSLVMFHHRADDAVATQALIHELGHAMGLPDYYDASAESTPAAGIADDGQDGEDEEEGADRVFGSGSGEAASSGSGARTSFGGRSTLGTFDPMADDMGDHNALSKWMLGWVVSDVTQVVSDGEGRARILGAGLTTGGGNAMQVGGSVVVSLGGFSDDGTGGCGGVIAIYPDGGDGAAGPVSDLWLLQYETAAGNQQVTWRSWQDRPEDAVPVGGGFRLFHARVSAGAKSTDGSALEFVDPDEGAVWHAVSSRNGIIDGISSESRRSDGYGGLLVAGDEMVLGDDDDICGRQVRLRVIRSDELGGTVEVSYLGS